MIVGVDRRHHFAQRKARAAFFGIEVEGAGEAVVGGEEIVGNVPYPGADDRTGVKRELDALRGLADLLDRRRSWLGGKSAGHRLFP